MQDVVLAWIVTLLVDHSESSQIPWTTTNESKVNKLNKQSGLELIVSTQFKSLMDQLVAVKLSMQFRFRRSEAQRSDGDCNLVLYRSVLKIHVAFRCPAQSTCEVCSKCLVKMLQHYGSPIAWHSIGISHLQVRQAEPYDLRRLRAFSRTSCRDKSCALKALWQSALSTAKSLLHRSSFLIFG